MTSGFFSNAEKHILSGNYNQAFIELFVGLDFVLAPDTEKSKKLKQRIALLSYTVLQKDFNAQVTELDGLYDARSNYVHSGINIIINDLIKLRNISRIVLWALYQLCLDNQNATKLKYQDWIVEIDSLVLAFFTKGKVPNQKELRTIGLKKTENIVIQESLDRYSVQLMTNLRGTVG